MPLLSRLLPSLIVVAALTVSPAAAFQGVPPPAPELKKLEFLVGKNTGKGKIYIPASPAADWTATDTTTWALDGHFLRTESKAVYAGVGFSEVSTTLMSYDSQAKVYRMWRFSNGTPTPGEGSGNFEGKKLVIMMKHAAVEQVHRATFEPREGKGCSFLLEQKTGDKWVKFLEGVFTPAQ